MRNVTKTINKTLEAYVRMLDAHPELRCELEVMLAEELAKAR